MEGSQKLHRALETDLTNGGFNHTNWSGYRKYYSEILSSKMKGLPGSQGLFQL